MVPVVLALPDNIKNHQTVWLDCGKIYSGELDIEGKEHITITTRGSCGQATITPAVPVTGWKREKNSSIWSAAIGFVPSQIEIEGKFLEQAHYPNRPQIWVQGHSRMPDRLQAQLPNADLTGATLVWRANDWLIMERPVLWSDGQTIMLGGQTDPEFGLLPVTDFYLEGKRWMLDVPGEWAYANGRLYLWPPDKRSPEGRVWAASRSRAINASHSREINITNIRITGATLGIDATDSIAMKISRVEIVNSGEEAILVGGKGFRMTNSDIRGSVKNGIRANNADVRDVQITHSRFSDTGMLGMPRRSKGTIVFEEASGQQITDNTISNSAYIAIRVFRDALVKNNRIDRACLRLTDCGGIYTYARDRQPLRVRIEGNHIRNLGGRLSHAIYLDDFANGVVVSGNRIDHNPGGIQLHNAFNNQISGNQFSDSRYEHILFNETAETASISRNHISNNHFSSAPDVPVFRLWSRHGDRYLNRFASFDSNMYSNIPAEFAEMAGKGMVSYQNWKRYESSQSVRLRD